MIERTDEAALVIIDDLVVVVLDELRFKVCQIEAEVIVGAVLVN